MLQIRHSQPTILDEFFNNFFAVAESQTNPTIRPVHDIAETDNEFLVDFYLAGIKKEDINIDVENDVLTIKAERKELRDLKYNRKESITGIFQKSFALPKNVNKDDINAKMENGVLKIVIPKKIEQPKLTNKKILVN